MADSVSNDSIENETTETSPKSALSTSFTISFEDEDQSISKQKKFLKTANLFVRKHVRTLSLPLGNAPPISKQTDSKSSADGQSKNNSSKEENSSRKPDKKKEMKHTKKPVQVKNNHSSPTKSSPTKSDNHLKTNGDCKKEKVSDSDSEGGTYTLDKDNEEVLAARKTIDQVFGISPVPEFDSTNDQVMNGKSKSHMVGEWIEQNAAIMKTASNKNLNIATNDSIKSQNYMSRIPSPLFGRRELDLERIEPSFSSKNIVRRSSIDSKQRNGNIKVQVHNTPEHLVNSPTNGDADTVSYLKETENIVAALHNRLQTDFKHSDELEKETPGSKYSNTRFNRAFSLRRDRLKKPGVPVVPVVNNTSIPIRTKNSVGKAVVSNPNLNKTNGHVNLSEGKKNSPRLCRPLNIFVSKTKEQTKPEDMKKKITQRLKVGGSLRSSSSLSAQEIEFQNWKRRKSYDPLKAAAEDRKKKSMMQSVSGSASVSTAALTKKEKPSDHNANNETSEKGIIRSASFHGLRNRNSGERFMLSGTNDINRSTSNRFISSSCLSSENSISSEDINNDDDDWMIPKPPSTSLQNTPPESVSSRLSLLSHALSSSSVILSSSCNTKVNYMTLLNVTQLTREILTAVSSMTDSLKPNGENSGEYSVSQKQNGYSYELKTKCSENIDNDNEEDTFNADNDFELDEDYNPDTGDDDSKSNDLSGNYQLNLALNNLKGIQEAVQKLQLLNANK